MVLALTWGLTGHAAIHLACLLAVHPDVRVTSGRRSPDHNRDVGGVENSLHLAGRAVDLVGPGTDTGAVAATAHAQRVTAGSTGPEEVLQEGDHLHVAW